MEKKNQHLVRIICKNSGDFEGQTLLMTHGVSTLDSLLKAGIEIDHSCGGNATCGTCLIHILSDTQQLPQRNELEQEMAQDRGFKEHERLACQLEVLVPMKLKIP